MPKQQLLGFFLLAFSVLEAWWIWRAVKLNVWSVGAFRRFDRQSMPEEFWFFVTSNVLLAFACLFCGAFFLAL
jgi:hypothetical protein